MKVLVSHTNNPEANLAEELTILTERLPDVLFLYINSPSVIVGRNQSPAAEADLSFCSLRGIPVLKRISGGGTVYHDPGNINYSFITAKTEKTVLDDDFLSPVVAALRSFGVEAYAGPRRDLWLDGKKISGTAAHVTRERQLFHGTLLYDTDLYVLDRVLQGDAKKRGKKVASVPSPVTNIRPFMADDLTPEDFFSALAEFFIRYYGS